MPNSKSPKIGVCVVCWAEMIWQESSTGGQWFHLVREIDENHEASTGVVLDNMDDEDGLEVVVHLDGSVTLERIETLEEL